MLTNEQDTNDVSFLNLVVYKEINDDDINTFAKFKSNGFDLKIIDLSKDDLDLSSGHNPDIILYFVSQANEESFHIDVSNILSTYLDSIFVAFYRTEEGKVGLEIAGCSPFSIFPTPSNDEALINNLNLVKNIVLSSKKRLNEEIDNYAGIIDELKDFYVELDLDGKIIRLNKAFENALGARLNEYKNTFFFTWFKSEQRGLAQLFFISVLKGVTRFKGEFTISGPSELTATLTPLSGKIIYKKGNPAGAALIFSNVTLLKQAENEIKENAEFEKVIFEALKILAFKMTRSGLIVDFKAGAKDKLLMNPDYIIGSDFRTLPLSQSSKNEIEAAISEVIDSGNSKTVEYSWKMPEKEREFFEARFFPAEDGLVNVFVLDVSSNKYSQILKDNKLNVYSESLNFVNGIAAKLDKYGNLIYLNEFGLNFFGVSTEYINEIGAGNLLFPSLVNQDNSTTLNSILNNPNDFLNFESDAFTLNGEKSKIFWKLKPVLSATGECEEILCFGFAKNQEDNAQAKKDVYKDILNKIFFIRKPDPGANIKEILTVVGRSLGILSLSVWEITKQNSLNNLYRFAENTIKEKVMEIPGNGLSHYFSILKHNKYAAFDGKDKTFAAKISEKMEKDGVAYAWHFPIRTSLGLSAVLIAEFETDELGKNFEGLNLLASIAERFAGEFDAKEKRKAELAYKDVSSTLKTLTSNEKFGVVFLDENLCINFINAVGAKYLGYLPAELNGSSLINFSPANLRSAFESSISNSFNNLSRFACETIFVSRNGEKKSFDFNLNVINRTNNSKMALIIFEDISLLKQKEDTLIQYKEIVETGNKLKNEFISNLGMEIKEPINSLLGFVRLLNDSPLDNIQKNYVNSLNNYSKTLVKLIDDILDYTKIDTDAEATNFSFVAPYDVFMELYAEHSSEAGDKDLNFTLLIDGSVPSQIVFDSQKLKQICHNLIDNAIKFTEYGYVRLFVNAENINYENKTFDFIINVEDSGIGISEADINLVFEPFSKLRDSKAKSSFGLGAGLTIVKKIVQSLSGEINIINSSGNGVCFKIKFPAVSYAILGDKIDRRNMDYYFKAIKPTAIIVYANTCERAKLEKSLKSGRLDTTTIAYENEIPYDLQGIRPGAFFIESKIIQDNLEIIKKLKNNIYFKNSLYFSFGDKIEFENEIIDGYFEYDKEFFIEKETLLSYGTSFSFINENRKELNDYDADNDLTETDRIEFKLKTRELLDLWEKAANSSIVSEITKFADILANEAEIHNIPSLVKYSGKLIKQLSEFEFDKFPVTLAMFPDVLNQIKLNHKD